MSDNIVQLFNEANDKNAKLPEQTRRLEKSEERLHHLAFYDVLVDLPNRLHFMNYLQNLLEDVRKNGSMTAVMFIDLDRFKQISNSLGHAVGNLLLWDSAAALNNIEKNIETELLGQRETLLQQVKGKQSGRQRFTADYKRRNTFKGIPPFI